MSQIIRTHINDGNTGNTARYDTGLWTTVAAFILLFFGGVAVLVTACSACVNRVRDERTSRRAVAEHKVRRSHDSRRSSTGSRRQWDNYGGRY